MPLLFFLRAMQRRWHISHAQGYLGLGMVAEAAAELEQVAPETLDELDAVALRVSVFQELKRWRPLREAALKLVQLQPDEPGGWIAWAYATRRTRTLAEAEKILLDAERLHPDEATIQFNLGCYACQLGQLGEARRRVDRAIALDPKFADAAGTDPDLAPLRAPPGE